MSDQIQVNGLSPRASKGHRGHRRTRSATNADFCGSSSSSTSGSSGSKMSITPTPSTQLGHFFNDPVPSARPPYSGGNQCSRLPALEEPSASSTAAVSTEEEAPSSCKGNNKQPVHQAGAFRLVAMVATALAVCLCIRTTAVNPGSNRAIFLRATSSSAADVQDRCTKVQGMRNLSIPGDRNQCASVLPSSIVEKETLSSWLVSVHVDRTPPSMEPAKRLRGAAPMHR